MDNDDFSKLLQDESFLNYCFSRNKEDVGYWEKWLQENPQHRERVGELKTLAIMLAEEVMLQEEDTAFNSLRKQIVVYENKKAKKTPSATSLWIGIAASFIAFLLFSVYIYLKVNSTENQQLASEIVHGGNKATLSLPDGRTIKLNEIHGGIILHDEHIVYDDGSTIAADIGRSHGHNDREKLMLTLTTPKGGQYQVTLPDGTRVWLNSASSLIYPVSFASQEERRVRLTGEGYFEVTPDKSLPFRVETSKQEIQVVGTRFNVNSYSDEPSEKTTLIEGTVKVTGGNGDKLLKPGQMATIDEGIQVSRADMKSVLSWKEGKFVFDDETLESIMRKIARWYDVEVLYQGANMQEKFGGTVSRYDHVSKVLKALELTEGVRFKIEGRRIIVMK